MKIKKLAGTLYVSVGIMAAMFTGAARDGVSFSLLLLATLVLVVIGEKLMVDSVRDEMISQYQEKKLDDANIKS